jgi:hypothetical protein
MNGQNSGIDPAEQAAQELVQQRREMSKAVEEVQPQIPKLPISTASTEKLVAWAKQPQVQSSIKILMEHPSRVQLAYAEGATFILILFFRWWVLTRTEGFFLRLTARLFIWALSVALLSFLLPYVFLGDAFAELMTGMMELAKTIKDSVE